MTDRIEIYRSGLRRKLRWRYVAGNGHILADSGQGYTRRIDALRAAASVTGTELDDFGLRLTTESRSLLIVEVAR